ncbi:MAG: SpoIIE family protein phosphatase [Gammaproteobacteria bacterium]|nr:SpoIIE family protein phosphatase [Gammaproteobacteria bacterium]
METLNLALLEVGTASLTRSGESTSGDMYAVVPSDGGVLLAVVDGIGHGVEAAHAAALAVATLQVRSQQTLKSLINDCHETLRASRGAVMSVAVFDSAANTLTWAGVGNVEGRLVAGNSLRTVHTLRLHGGTLGHRVPPMDVSVLPVTPGDILIFATDGVRDSFCHDLPLHISAQKIAEHIMAREARCTDDALVLVARYLG